MKWSEILELQANMPMQNDKNNSIPEQIVRIAWEEYHEEHPAQSFERIHERGGFGKYEIITLLYKRILKQDKAKTNETS